MELTSAALLSGKHVLPEKPMDISASRAAALNKVAQESGKVFGIVFNQRTNELFQRARKIVRGRQLGELAANSRLKDTKISDKHNTAYQKRWQINW